MMFGTLCSAATSMNKYLVKIAESKDQGKAHSSPVADALGAHILGGIASTPLAIAGNAAGFKTMNLRSDPKSSADLGTIKKFMKDNKLHKKVTFNAREHSIVREKLTPRYAQGLKQINHFVNPAYLHNTEGRGFIGGVRHPSGKGPGGKRISNGTVNKDIIMHELGHAKDFASNSKIKKIGTTLGRHPLSRLSGGVATVGMLSNEKTRDHAALIPAAQAALVMREEGMANYHAYKGVKAHKGVPAANKFLKRMVVPNTLNYGLVMGAPIAGTIAGKHILNYMDKKRAEKAKNAND